MRSRLWARTTGADKKKQFPEQQATSMGRVGDFAIINPYGFFCDLPANTLIRVLDNGVAIPCAVDRPSDIEQGEPVFYHPVTNTRIIARNSGDLDIICDEAEGSKGNVNITCNKANITADDSVNITAPLTKITGDFEVTGATALSATVTSNGKDISDTHKHDGSLTAPNGPVSDTGVVS